MNYYQINDDFYTFPNQLFITEIKGFSNPTSKKTPSELLKEGHTSWVICPRFNGQFKRLISC
jgi:hypothetical protein